MQDKTGSGGSIGRASALRLAREGANVVGCDINGINTASVSAWMGYKMLPGLAHSAAKGGVLSLTRHLAMEGRGHGVRANSVSPGLIETHQTRPHLANPEWREAMLGRIMLDRMGQPEKVAAVVAFLASEDAST